MHQTLLRIGSTFLVLIKNEGVGLLTLDPDGTETIDGATTLDLKTGQSALIMCDGTDLRTVFPNQIIGSDVQAYDADLTSIAGLMKQTWANVSGSRAAETSYQNTTGAPIEVAISLIILSTATNTATIRVSSDNFTWINIHHGRNTGDRIVDIFTVPDDWYYELNIGSSHATINHWAELS